jgi:hypothetical protein
MSKPTGLYDFLSKAGSTLPEETVHVEQWSRDVVLRGLSSRERDVFEEENLRRASAKAGNGLRKREAMEPDLENFRGRLVARHIVEDGARTFANKNGEDILGDQPASVIDPLFAVAQRLSGFSAKDIEELTKNSEVTPESEHSIVSQGSQADQSVN